MGRSFMQVCRLATRLVPLALVLSVSAVYAGNVGVDLNIQLGNQPRQIVLPPPIAPEQEIYFEEDIDFVYPSQLGFYVAVGVPYDLFFLNSSYYLYRDGGWFRAPGSRGPWMTVRHRELPPGLRRHKIERIRTYRNTEHDVYRHNRDNYRGKHFITRKEEWKEQRRDEKEHRKEMKRDEKEERKLDREERKQHRSRNHDKD